MGVTRRNPKKQTKLFVPGIFAVAVYLWCCNSLGKADFNSAAEHEDGSQRLRSLKIQGLELRIDAVVNEFKSSSLHCEELGVEILAVASELKEQISAFHKAYVEGDGFGDKFTKDGNKSKKGFFAWINKFGPALQIMGLISTTFVIIRLFRAFQKSQFPRIAKNWNTFLQKVTFDPTFDYMIDVIEFNNNSMNR